MATIYTGGGYTTPKAPTVPKLAKVAAASDPFGLASGTAGILGVGGNTGSASAAAQGYSTIGPPQVGAAGSNGLKPPSITIQDTSPWGPGAIPQTQTTAPTAQPLAWDPNTDPAYQAVAALTGMNDQQAQAAAAQQKRNALLAYGDSGLINSVLGDSALAQAAANNPTSTEAQLKQQYQQGLDTLNQQLGQQNLTFSGYRVKQDQQAATNYQNSLAQAAAAINNELGQIDANLNSTLNQNAYQRAMALFQAEANQAQNPDTSGDTGDGTGSGGGDGSQYSTTGVGLSAAQTAAAEQAARRLALAAQGYWTAGL